MFLVCSSWASAANYPSGSPVAINGKLKVSGTQLVNECGNPVQLRGMSTHGPQWFKNCICTESLDLMVNEWGISLFRIAMYVQESGYVTDPSGWRSWICSFVDACEERGVYCIIDWHVLNPGNPNVNLNDSKEFWKFMSDKYKDKSHVLYEICNEPNGVQWSQVKEYADAVTKVIRDNQDETVVIVGTPMWNQDVDIASQNKLSFSNIMYTLHFYAGTHGEALRKKAETAMNNGAAIFVTEFGTSTASGDGGYSPDATRTWVSWMNEKKISWANWSYSDKGEVSAALVSGSCNSRNWNNVTQSGALIKSLIKENAFSYTACNGQQQGGNGQGGQQQGDNHQQGDNGQGGQQQGDNQQHGDNNQGEQQHSQAAQCPNLVDNIAIKNIYRIVNKNSCRVLSFDDTQENAKLIQKNRDENDKKQWFQLQDAGDYYLVRNMASNMYLTNKYNPNDGADIVQNELSNYENPSERWKISKQNGTWFRFENKSCNNSSSALEVSQSMTDDGAQVVQSTNWASKDNQLWGFEFVSDGTDVRDSEISTLSVLPTIVDDEFTVLGDENEYTEVSIYSLAGVKLKEFSKHVMYNVSDFSAGTYFVILFKNGVAVKRLTILKR